jgi:hypothetical protein
MGPFSALALSPSPERLNTIARAITSPHDHKHTLIWLQKNIDAVTLTKLLSNWR